MKTAVIIVVLFIRLTTCIEDMYVAVNAYKSFTDEIIVMPEFFYRASNV
ncbi:MAG: hypothetical protein Q9M11_04915 [Mariprofundaceae bacterium]|nr:hypothetical protein [Mariprofundaceae bacterium]